MCLFCLTLELSCRLSTVRNATNIVVMKAGRITEQGTHAQLMMQRGIYYSLVKRQAGDGTLGTKEEEQKKVRPCITSTVQYEMHRCFGGAMHGSNIIPETNRWLDQAARFARR